MHRLWQGPCGLFEMNCCRSIRELQGLDREPGCLAQEYTAKLGALQAKGDDYDIAAAQIGVEVYSAMNAAMGQ